MNHISRTNTHYVQMYQECMYDWNMRTNQTIGLPLKHLFKQIRLVPIGVLISACRMMERYCCIQWTNEWSNKYERQTIETKKLSSVFCSFSSTVKQMLPPNVSIRSRFVPIVYRMIEREKDGNWIFRLTHIGKVLEHWTSTREHLSESIQMQWSLTYRH